MINTNKSEHNSKLGVLHLKIKFIFEKVIYFLTNVTAVKSANMKMNHCFEMRCRLSKATNAPIETFCERTNASR